MFKKVKIIATIGPTSESPEMIRKLIDAGVNIFRINFSHSSRDKVLSLVKKIRTAEKETGKLISIMGDLAGPKVRIGPVAPGVVLAAGDMLKIVSEQVAGTREQISINMPVLLDRLQKGMVINIGDGAIQLVVERKFEGGVMARVSAGGNLESRKGFSVEGMDVASFSLSSKDKNDIITALKTKMDALAISFVQRPNDIKFVKSLLPKVGAPILIAKIETAAGVKNASQILDEADGLMIARGDLGLTMPMEELPYIQKRLIALALRKAKPAITATQMLESMIYNHLPTRAEVTDVAKAVLDGTDCVMLSGETAVGKFPAETVRMMYKIIEAAIPRIMPRRFPDENLVADAVSTSAVSIADQLKAKLIIVFTGSGATAKRIARYRPPQAIVALSPDHAITHRLNFSWGIAPIVVKNIKKFDELISQAKIIASKNDFISLKKNEHFVISAGVPFGKSGTTNLVLVERA